MNSKFHTIITHKRPHFDELVAIVLLQNFGDKKFPGIKNAKVDFWDAGAKTPDGRGWQTWHKDGYILVGVGGSCFDEHPNKVNGRKRDECAATLVAKHLEIEHDPYLKKILQYTLSNDTHVSGHPLEFPRLIQLINKRWFDKAPQDAIEWAMQIILLFIYDQMEFFKTKEEFERCAQQFEGSYNSSPIVIVTVESDSEQMNALARSQHGGNADVVIQKNSKGQVLIFSANKSHICLDEVIKLIRTKEMKMNGRTVCSIDGTTLAKEGEIPGAEVWHYDRQANRILNGSLSAPNTPPTKIPLEIITTFVIEGLDEKVFHPNFSHDCQRGRCHGKECPWFTAQLNRCVNHRAA